MGIFVKKFSQTFLKTTEEQRTIFFDVKCSMALEEAIEELGGT